jgi:hypothetical protein
MAECTRRAPIMPLNSEELDEVTLAIQRLQKQVKEQPKPINEFDEIKNDIEIPEESSEKTETSNENNISENLPITPDLEVSSDDKKDKEVKS